MKQCFRPQHSLAIRGTFGTILYQNCSKRLVLYQLIFAIFYYYLLLVPGIPIFGTKYPGLLTFFNLYLYRGRYCLNRNLISEPCCF